MLDGGRGARFGAVMRREGQDAWVCLKHIPGWCSVCHDISLAVVAGAGRRWYSVSSRWSSFECHVVHVTRRAGSTFTRTSHLNRARQLLHSCFVPHSRT